MAREGREATEAAAAAQRAEKVRLASEATEAAAAAQQADDESLARGAAEVAAAACRCTRSDAMPFILRDTLATALACAFILTYSQPIAHTHTDLTL